MQVQAAAISLAGRQFVVVVSSLDLLERPGEADMAIDRLSAGFGGVPVVLMAQRENGSPVYYGEQDIVASLRDLPLDEMPWKEYHLPG